MKRQMEHALVIALGSIGGKVAIAHNVQISKILSSNLLFKSYLILKKLYFNFKKNYSLRLILSLHVCKFNKLFTHVIKKKKKDHILFIFMFKGF